MKFKLKVGDEVVCVKSFKDEAGRGKRGKVIMINKGMEGKVVSIDGTPPIGVIWKDFSKGHTLYGLLPDNAKNGYWVDYENVRPIKGFALYSYLKENLI